MANNRRSGGWVPLLRSYPDSEKINKVSIGAECLYVRLLTVVDDPGNFYAESHMITGKLFAARWKKNRQMVGLVRKWVHELKTSCLISLYAAGGVSLLHIMNYPLPHRKDKAWYVTFPLPACDDPVTVEARVRDGSVSLPQPGPLPLPGQGQQPTTPTDVARCAEAFQSAFGRAILRNTATQELLNADIAAFGVEAILETIEYCRTRPEAMRKAPRSYEYISRILHNKQDEQTQQAEAEAARADEVRAEFKRREDRDRKGR